MAQDAFCESLLLGLAHKSYVFFIGFIIGQSLVFFMTINLIYWVFLSRPPVLNFIPQYEKFAAPPIKNHPLVHLCHVELQETRLKLKQMLSARPVGVAWVEKDLQLTADMNDHEWFDMISNIRDHISNFSRNYL